MDQANADSTTVEDPPKKEESKSEEQNETEAEPFGIEEGTIKAETITIAPQSKHEISVTVEEGQVLSWGFTLKGTAFQLGMDIGFCVKKRIRSKVDGEEVITDWELPWNGYGKLGGSVSSFFASNRDVVRYAAGSAGLCVCACVFCLCIFFFVSVN